MNIIFLNSKNNKTSDPHYYLILQIKTKIKKKEVFRMLLYQILASTIHGKYKTLLKNNKFEMLAQR